MTNMILGFIAELVGGFQMWRSADENNIVRFLLGLFIFLLGYICYRQK